MNKRERKELLEHCNSAINLADAGCLDNFRYLATPERVRWLLKRVEKLEQIAKGPKK